MNSPAVRIDELPAAAQAARLETEHLWARRTRLGAWQAHRLEGGTISLSVQVHDRHAWQKLTEFTASACVYFDGRPRTSGDQGPHLDVTVPGRVAVVWRTGGVWVELWHPDPATAPTEPVEPATPVVKARPTPALLGARLPFTRRKTHTTT